MATILISQSLVNAQIIPSSCDADDEVIDLRKPIAARLAIRWLRASQSADSSLIQIPQVHLDSIMDALIAVYNAEGLEGHDTLKNCYTSSPDLNHYVILCDTNSPWNNAWSQGNLLTGDNIMDSLLNFLEFEFVEYEFSSNYNAAFIEFYTEKIFNVYAVCNLFLKYDEISIAFTYNDNSIESRLLNYSTENGIRKLTYSYGWGDCLSGCTYWKHWNINVYNDCSVEIVGHNPPFYTGIDENQNLTDVSTFPNPFSKSTTISYYLQKPTTVKINIFNNLGKQVHSFQQNQNQGEQKYIWSAQGLNEGYYYYQIQIVDKMFSGKIIKVN